MKPVSSALPGRSLAFRLFLATVMASLLVSLLATGIHVFYQYRTEVAQLESTLELIEKVHVPAIAGSLFAVNDEQIVLHLRGLLNFPDIVFAEVREEKENYRYQRALGRPMDSGAIRRTFELFHPTDPGASLFLGVLSIHADYQDLHDRIQSSASLIALTTFSQIFITALLIFLLAQRYVTRRLVGLADYANRLDPDNLEEPPRLRRRRGRSRNPDEIDRVAAAFDNLRLRIREHIRKRESMNRRLRESEARFRSLTDNLPVGVFRVSPDDRIVFVNPAIARMLAFDSAREMEGRNPQDFYLNPEDRLRLRPLWNGLPSIGPLEMECLRNDGSVFWGSLRATRFQDEAGNLIAIDGTLEDVTPRRKAETAARRRTRELETLYQMGREAAEGLSLERTLGAAAERLRTLLPADLVVIFLTRGDELKLEARTAFASSTPWVPAESHAVGQCLCGLAAETAESAFSCDILADPRCTLSECKAAGLRSFAAIPLGTRGETIGVLGLAAQKETDFRVHQSFLETVAGALTHSIHNLRLYESLEKNAQQLKRRLKDLEISRKMIKITENRFRSFFDSNPEGVFLLDFFGMIQDANRAAREITGYEKDQLQGRAFRDLVSPDFRNDVNGLVETISTGRIVNISMEIPCRRADGPEFPAAIRTWRVQDEKENVLAVGLFLRDLSEEKALVAQKATLERQLQHAQKMEAIGTLAGGIAHDFNNILGGVIGFAELAIEHETRNPDRLPHFHRRLLEACIRARELVEQILKFNRRELSELKAVRLSAVAKEVVQFLGSSLPATIKISQRLEAENDWVLGDPSQLHQVLVNLCTNAYHAMRPGPGRLTLALREVQLETALRCYGREIKPGKYAVLEVRDTGTGIPSHCQDRIFEPYFTTKDMQDGTGLGLSVSFAIVKSHGGLIDFETREGEGTTFRVYLPVSEPRSADPPAVAAVPTGRGERIMVVDDELFFLDVLREHLETLEYDPVGFQNSPQAWKSFQAHPDYFDLVITDQTMPEMTGFRLIEEIRTIRSDTPIILCTGFSETVTEASVKQFGLTRFLMKPVHRASLAQTVFELLGERRNRGPDPDH
ncbi:MAG: PAS domain S-box protein [Desulfococcaceae bacterium]